MTQEEINLLFTDLCGRIQYGVKCQCFDEKTITPLTGIKSNTELYFDELDYKEFDGIVKITYCKPYLFPLSSMTEEQMKEITKRYNYYNIYGTYIEITNHIEGYWDDDNSCNLQDYLWLEDWYNKNHFDYRGLIEKGLAIDATDKNIY